MRPADRIPARLRWACAAGLAAPAAGNAAHRVQERRLGLLLEPTVGFAVSRHGLHLACVTRKGEKSRVVVDDQPGPGCDGVGRPVFSPDGRRVAYAASKGSKWSVVLDSHRGPAYDGIVKRKPTLHPDGVVEYLAGRDRVLYRVKRLP